MDNLKDFYSDKKKASDARFDSFDIEPISSIKKISEDAYLESPTWLGGDNEFVCLFIDLDKSSAMSFRHQPKTMAKVYDYFTQNIVDFLMTDPFRADYIDIKGDGAFGIYEGPNATFKALCAALSFKTFFEKCIRWKFQGDVEVMNCKIGIDKDKVLVKKIGKRGDNNEVWAGRVVNHASKLASLTKDIYAVDTTVSPMSHSLLVISDKVRDELEGKRPYTTISCGHDFSGNQTNKTVQNWTAFDCADNESLNCDKAWYTGSKWCDTCGDAYMFEILK